MMYGSSPIGADTSETDLGEFKTIHLAVFVGFSSRQIKSKLDISIYLYIL